MSKKSKSSTTTTPYSGDYKDWVYDVKNQLWTNNNTPAAAYTGPLNAGVNQAQTSAISGLSGLTDTAALTDTINGKFLDSDTNPYLRKTYDIAADNVNKAFGEQADTYDSKFGSSSFWGGSQHQKAYQDLQKQEGQTLNDLNTQIYGGAYDQERNRQMNAINQAGSIFGNLYNLGQSQYENDQSGLDRNYAEQLRQWGVDENDTDRIMQLLGLVKNPSSTTTQSDGGASFGSAVGSLGAALITCFIAGTIISTPDGGKPIEEIKEGDIVTTPKGTSTVINTEIGLEYPVTITCERGEVVTTPTQPILTAMGWMVPIRIRPGDEILGKVLDIVFGLEQIIVYDITVDGDNVFFANGFTVEGGFTKEGE